MPKTIIHHRRRTKVADDIEMIIVEHDFCFHCSFQRSCSRRENLIQTANQQELGFVVTRCPEFEEA